MITTLLILFAPIIIMGLALVVEEQIVRRLIRGKFDSQFKQEFNVRTNRFTGRLERGTFDTAMNYARRNQGGVALIQHARNQPWETWRAR